MQALYRFINLCELSKLHMIHDRFAIVLFQYLGDIEEHLGETISTANPDLKVPTNEYDGKVVYGQKRKTTGTLCSSALKFVNHLGLVLVSNKS